MIFIPAYPWKVSLTTLESDSQASRRVVISCVYKEKVWVNWDWNESQHIGPRKSSNLRVRKRLRDRCLPCALNSPITLHQPRFLHCLLWAVIYKGHTKKAKQNKNKNPPTNEKGLCRSNSNTVILIINQIVNNSLSLVLVSRQPLVGFVTGVNGWKTRCWAYMWHISFECVYQCINQVLTCLAVAV